MNAVCDSSVVGGGLVQRRSAGEEVAEAALDVVAGEQPSGVQRAAAAADFGNGVSGGLPYDRFTFINPDLTIHLLRPPVGEWIGMRAASFYGRPRGFVANVSFGIQRTKYDGGLIVPFTWGQNNYSGVFFGGL